MKRILVRYGELTLKGNNKNYFISALIDNIKNKLNDYKKEINYKKDYNSLTIEILNENILNDVIGVLKNIFGIYSISVVDIVEKDVDKICDKVLETCKKYSNTTFKIEVERKDKSFKLTSPELKKIISTYVLKNVSNLIVDVHKPNVKVDIVVKKDGVYIFDKRIKCLGGLPVGVTGRGLSLISGGIDSPVASFLGLKRGLRMDYLHFITPPFTKEESVDKVKNLLAHLKKFNFNNANLYICNFSDFLNEISHIKLESYKIIIMRRAFMRIANLLAERINAKAIITGESLGQVASQTIESISVINETSVIPILRPLITYDKSDIIDIAKQINTYETSIIPFDDACSLFVPNNPVTKPRNYIAKELESNILFEQFINHTFENNIKLYNLDDKGNWNEQ